MSKLDDMGELVVTVPAGIAYSVSDAAGVELTTQAKSARFQYPPGLYRVEWFSGSERSEIVVRVAPGKPGHADFASTQTSSARARDVRKAGAAEIVKALRPSERDHGSKIAVVILAQSEAKAAQAMGDLRLLRSEDDAMRASDGASMPLSLSNKEVARVYNIPPGRFTLSFRSHAGATLQQTVPALKGRTTIVFLTCVSGKVVVAKGNSFANVSRLGIDPAQTIMISAKGNEADQRIRERMRLTRLLMGDLSGGTAVLTESFCKILDQRSTDPLLKLAGATAVLLRLETQRQPSLELALENPSPTDPITEIQWMKKAMHWLPRSNFHRMPSDTVAAWWQIENMGGEKPSACPATLMTPPMFASGWRWAVGVSARRPSAIRKSSTTLAASRSTGDAGPWLCWRPRAATARPEQAVSDDRSIAMLCGALRERIESMEVPDDTDKRLRFIEMLKPDDRSIIALLDQTGGERDGDMGAAMLASALGLPGPALRRRILHALTAIDEAIPKFEQHETDRRRTKSVRSYRRASFDRASPEQSGSLKSSQHLRRKQAPALNRTITVPDDPQSGRFGGEARRGTFSVAARFRPLKSGRWVTIELEVKGDAADGRPVQFFLHDSFRPQMEEVCFKDRKARLTVTAWGGFTVGVWLPYEGVELELDLAKLPDAPTAIRER